MELSLIVFAGILVGVTSIIKSLVTVNTRWIPLIVLVAGIALMLLGGPLIGVLDWREQIIGGIVIGLQAMGLYSGGKTLADK